MQKLKDYRLWLEGLVGASIQGAAVTISAIAVKPASFNLDTELIPTLKLALINGLVGASLYLRQRPLPGRRSRL